MKRDISKITSSGIILESESDIELLLSLGIKPHHDIAFNTIVRTLLALVPQLKQARLAADKEDFKAVSKYEAAAQKYDSLYHSFTQTTENYISSSTEKGVKVDYNIYNYNILINTIVDDVRILSRLYLDGFKGAKEVLEHFLLGRDDSSSYHFKIIEATDELLMQASPEYLKELVNKDVLAEEDCQEILELQKGVAIESPVVAREAETLVPADVLALRSQYTPLSAAGPILDKPKDKSHIGSPDSNFSFASTSVGDTRSITSGMSGAEDEIKEFEDCLKDSKNSLHAAVLAGDLKAIKKLVKDFYNEYKKEWGINASAFKLAQFVNAPFSGGVFAKYSPLMLAQHELNSLNDQTQILDRNDAKAGIKTPILNRQEVEAKVSKIKKAMQELEKYSPNGVGYSFIDMQTGEEKSLTSVKKEMHFAISNKPRLL